MTEDWRLETEDWRLETGDWSKFVNTFTYCEFICDTLQ